MAYDDAWSRHSFNGAHTDERVAHDRATVAAGFWNKVRRVAGSLPFAEELLAAYYCALDRETPRQVQVALLGALAYFVVPIDFAPDMLPLLGFTDDAAVLAAAVRMVASHINQRHRDAARRALADGLPESDRA